MTRLLGGGPVSLGCCGDHPRLARCPDNPSLSRHRLDPDRVAPPSGVLLIRAPDNRGPPHHAVTRGGRPCKRGPSLKKSGTKTCWKDYPGVQAKDFRGLLRKLIDCGQHKMFFVAPIASVLPHSIRD